MFAALGTLLFVLLVVFVALIQHMRKQITITRKELLQERLRRIAWERAAGLPFWDKQETENALWVRASVEKDQMSEDVLSTLYFDQNEDFFKN